MKFLCKIWPLFIGNFKDINTFLEEIKNLISKNNN